MPGVNYSGSYAAPRLDLGEAMWEYMFEQDEFIGVQLLPIFRTPKKTATFSKILREALLRPADDVKRRPHAPYSRDGFEAEDFSYECEERGHEVPVDESEREFYASDFDADRVATAVAMWRVLYDQEIAIRDLVQNTTTFTTGNGLRTDVSTAWSTASADVIGDVATASESIRSRTGKKANVLAIGAATLKDLLLNTAIRAALGTNRDKGMRAIFDTLRALFDVEEILVGRGIVNSANEGQTFSASDIWSSSWAIVARKATESDPLNMPVLGRTMLWVNDSPANVMVEEYMEQQTRSTVFRARTHSDEVLVDTSFMQLLDIAG